MPPPYPGKRLPQHPVVTAVVAYDQEVSVKGTDITVAPSFYSFWWVRQGWAKVDGEFGTRRTPAGQGLFLSAGVQRHQTFASDTMLLSLSFIIAWEDGQPFLDSRPPLAYRQDEREDLVSHAEAACRFGPGRNLSTTGWLNFQGPFYSFVNAAIQWATRKGFQILAPQEADPRLDGIIREVRHSPVAGPLPFERWQKMAGLSRSQINRLAREYLGESLHAYRDRNLVARLRQRLLTGTASIKELAAEHNFVDPAHLCHWLKRHTGATPTEIRDLAA